MFVCLGANKTVLVLINGQLDELVGLMSLWERPWSMGEILT
jgi:hypothetical protein